MAGKKFKQMIADTKDLLCKKDVAAQVASATSTEQDPPEAVDHASESKGSSAPSAARKRFLFTYTFDLYSEGKFSGVDDVTVEADTEEEAMELTLETLARNGVSTYRYTGRFTKKAIE